MFGRLFLLFLVVPLVDLALLVALGDRIGLGTTVAIVVLTALMGSWLAKREGVAAWRRVQTKMSAGAVPGPELLDGLVILVAGTLLLTPGFLTDAVGLLGLVPVTRKVARGWIKTRVERAVLEGRLRVVHGPLAGQPPAPDPPRPTEDADLLDDGTGRSDRRRWRL